jgi:hypothetical protein
MVTSEPSQGMQLTARVAFAIDRSISSCALRRGRGVRPLNGRRSKDDMALDREIEHAFDAEDLGPRGPVGPTESSFARSRETTARLDC